jgi:agmatinase
MKQFLGKENPCDDIQSARVVIVPIPFENSTSYIQGTAKGPEAILSASPYLELYDEELNTEAYHAGIYTIEPLPVSSNADKMMQVIESSVHRLLKMGKFMIALGGEHTISYGIVRGIRNSRSDFSVLQFDAHSDLRNTYESSRLSHACVMRRIWEINKQIVQVGIRAQSIEERQFMLQHSIPTYYAQDMGSGNFPEKIINDLTDDVYITFDVDFFDPSVIPSTGTPEPGGFFWNETMAFLRQIFERKNVLGLDVVELSPVPGLHHPDFTIAKLIYKLIGYYLEGDST